MSAAGRALAAPLLAAALFAAPPRPAAAAPAIAFATASCDLGSLLQGEQPSCSFAFRNAGDGELEIRAVEPSCGCTSAVLAAPRLASGAEGAIRVTFDSSSFTGEIAKEVTVRSNDPARPSVTLTLRANVEPEIDFEPREVVLDAPAPGSVARDVVVLVNRRADAVRVRAIGAEPASFTCAIPSWADPRAPLRVESWDRLPIEVACSPPAPPVMPLAGLCTLVIEGPRKREFTLKLLALPR